jgi:hypothetical protein
MIRTLEGRPALEFGKGDSVMGLFDSEPDSGRVHDTIHDLLQSLRSASG